MRSLRSRSGQCGPNRLRTPAPCLVLLCVFRVLLSAGEEPDTRTVGSLLSLKGPYPYSLLPYPVGRIRKPQIQPLTAAALLSGPQSAVRCPQPVVSRVDTPREFCWRIRNLPYGPEVYAVTAEGREIVVRTSNKKYFKRIQVRLSRPLLSRPS